MANATDKHEDSGTVQQFIAPTGVRKQPVPTNEHTEVNHGSGQSRASARASGKPGSLKLPQVGESVFGFSLRRELGRGAFARVFLAEQATLACRPVALKVSSIVGDEPQKLAQLQHTNIVPIYSVHEDAALGLRAVCMPFFGGASLSEVLQRLFAQNQRPERGAELVSALADVSPPAALPTRALPIEGLPSTAENGPRGLLRSMSYTRAAAWIVLRLAEALHHAHHRGILHRDIKPSNVLLCGDGQPMLLDFNVSQEVNSLKTQAKVVMGGTVAYMAPEQLRAIVERNAELARQVNHQADLYSLGMVLCEMISGGNPFQMSGSYSPAVSQLEVMARERSQTIPSLRKTHPELPWSLESIARKCLEPDLTRRYQYGEELAEDLRRFLEDRPLKHAPELSWVERGRKWVRRHPRLTSSVAITTLAATLLLMSAGALVAVRRHLAQTQHDLHLSQVLEKKRAFEEGTRRALCLVNTRVEVAGHVRQGLQACQDALAIFDILSNPEWQQAADWQLLTAEDQQRLAADARELLLLLANARVRAAPGDKATLQEALVLLERAEAIATLGVSRGLLEERADYLAQLGDEAASRAVREQTRSHEPSTAREYYLLATSLARQARSPADWHKVRDALSKSLDRDDRYYWAWLQRAICYAELGDWPAAAGDFGVCIGQWPDFVYGYYNRGYALDRSGNRTAALEDYTRALERDPAFVPAYLSRGLLHLEEQRHQPALADLHEAVRRGQDDATVHAGCGAALEGLKRFGEADAAFAAAFARLDQAPPESRTHIRLLFGFAVARRLPDAARTAFAAIPPDDPRHVQALYGLATVHVEQNQPREALKVFDRIVQLQPEFTQARRFRAIIRARLRDLEGASQDINLCLEQKGREGATLYAAACVAALAWEQTRDPSAAEQATFFLEKALALHYGQDKVVSDPDLNSLRENPKFQELIRKFSGVGHAALFPATGAN